MPCLFTFQLTFVSCDPGSSCVPENNVNDCKRAKCQGVNRAVSYQSAIFCLCVFFCLIDDVESNSQPVPPQAGADPGH